MVEIPNWLEILSKKIEDFTDEEIETLPVLSHSWNSCACASLNVPKDAQGIPLDEELSNLGKKFNNDGVSWLFVYIKNYRNTSEDEMSNGFKLKEIRFELAEKYQRRSLKFLNGIKERYEEILNEVSLQN